MTKIRIKLDGNDTGEIECTDDTLHALRSKLAGNAKLDAPLGWSFQEPTNDQPIPLAQESRIKCGGILRNGCVGLVSVKRGSDLDPETNKQRQADWAAEAQKLAAELEAEVQRSELWGNELRQRPDTRLDGLRPVLKPGDNRERIGQLLGNDGKLRKSAVLTPEAIAAAVIENGKLPRLVAQNEGGHLIAKNMRVMLADGVSAADLVRQKNVSISNRSNTSVEAYESEFLCDQHNSNFFKLMTSVAASGNLKGVDVTFSRSVGYQSTEENRETNKERSLYISAVHNIEKAIINIPRQSIKIKDNIIENFQAATSSGKSADGIKNDLRVLLMDGYLVPCTYSIGGQLLVKESKRTNSNLLAVRSERSASFTQFIKAALPQEKAAVSGKLGVGGGKTDTNKSERLTEWEGNKFDVVGGDPLLQHYPADWVQSLDDPSTLEVIGFEQFVPIWEFFDEELKAKVKSHLTIGIVKEEMEAAIKDFVAQKAKYESLADLKIQFKNYVSNNTKFWENTQIFGVQGMPKEEKVYETEVKETWKGFIGFIPYGGTCEATKYVGRPTIKDDWVITRINVKSHWDPNGYFMIKSGGILDDHLEVYFESRGTRGHCWTLEVYAAPKATLKPTRNIESDAVLYQALAGMKP